MIVVEDSWGVWFVGEDIADERKRGWWHGLLGRAFSP